MVYGLLGNTYAPDTELSMNSHSPAEEEVFISQIRKLRPREAACPPEQRPLNLVGVSALRWVWAGPHGGEGHCGA